MSYTEPEQRLLKALGESIRHHRKAKGLSQEKLAWLSEIDRSYMGSVERGERNIAILNLQKIAATIGVTLSELVAGLDDEAAGRKQ